ncbi:MAG: DNA repair protein RecO [Chromatiales bacterium]|nr:DNA repair protein RecO [Chromatiales bacterium]
MSLPARVTLEAAWILHRRPYRDSSEIIDLVTLGHGRISAVSRGSRSRRPKVPLEPFQPIHASWVGRGELVTLTGAEPRGPGLRVTGRRLLSMFYVNELLLRLTVKQDHQPDVFRLYENTIKGVASAPQEAVWLRNFESALLDALGYGLSLETDTDGCAVQADAYYRYYLEEGPQRVEDHGHGALTVSGGTLLAIKSGSYDNPEQLSQARHLLTAAMDLYLGGRPLKTRQVLNEMRSRSSRPRVLAK